MTIHVELKAANGNYNLYPIDRLDSWFINDDNQIFCGCPCCDDGTEEVEDFNSRTDPAYSETRIVDCYFCGADEILEVRVFENKLFTIAEFNDFAELCMNNVVRPDEFIDYLFTIRRKVAL